MSENRVPFHETTINSDEPHGYSDMDFSGIQPTEDVDGRMNEMRLCTNLEEALVDWRDGLDIEMTPELCAAWDTLMHRISLEYVYRRFSCDRADGGYAKVRLARM